MVAFAAPLDQLLKLHSTILDINTISNAKPSSRVAELNGNVTR